MTIIHGDILEWAKTYDGPKFHALLTDCPYEMEFMGRGWDDSGISFNPSTWKALAAHLLPGAFLFVMAGTLNDDLISVSMREAGLRKYHKTVHWGYGQGFPKASNIAAGVDAHAFRDWLAARPLEQADLKALRTLERAARKAKDTRASSDLRLQIKVLITDLRIRADLVPMTVGTKKQTGAKFKLTQELIDNGGFNDPDRTSFDLHAPVTEMAKRWMGHRYGGQMLKPSVETILIFQKPYDGSALDCITRTGAGALWIDGARIGSEQISQHGRSGDQFGFASPEPAGRDWSGRWPANLILSHAPTCNGTCASGCPVAALGAQSGELQSGKLAAGMMRNAKGGFHNSDAAPVDQDFGGDSGTAARFFFQADYMAERMELADNPLGYKCVICGCKEQRYGIMSEKHNTISEEICDHVTSAENSLSQQNEFAGSVPMPALQKQPRASAAKSGSNPTPAHNATSSSRNSPGIAQYTVPESAPDWQVAQIAQDAQSVVSLCDSCATAIAQSLVAMQHGSDAALPLGKAFIPERKKRILIQSLALSAASRERSDTTPTIADLSTLFGFVELAIANSPSCQEAPATPLLYYPKSPRSEREAGLDPRQIAMLRLLDDSDDSDDFDETTVGDGRNTPIDNPFQRGETARRNTHPTLKPLSLTRHLATLLLPPPEYGPRRLLIPFSGAASEYIGAMLAGWEDITGIELEEEYVKIANSRIVYWQQRRWEFGDISRKLTIKASVKVPQGQADMFTEEVA